MENTGNYYLIRHITLMTGFSDRTIRSYIADGILQGEQINGMWHFTPEQVESFLYHPRVRAGLSTKHHAAVYDFLADNHKSACEACLIVDLPNRSPKAVAEYFCYKISNQPYQNIRFSFDGMSKTPRVILKGDTAEVLRLINAYTQESPKETDEMD